MKAVNLLPEKDRPFVPSGRRQGSAYVVLGGLGLVLVALVAYVVVANQVTDRRAEAAQARAQTARAEAEASRLGGFQDFAAMKAARTAAVTKLASERFDFERLSLELARVVPEGVFVTEITAFSKGQSDSATPSSSGPAPSSGGSGASSSGSAPSSGGSGASSSSGGGGGGAAGGDAGDGSPTLQLVGCAPTQSVVATTLVRLRSLYRAEDVSLNDSKRAASEGAAPGSSATQGSSGSAPPASSGSATSASPSGDAGCEGYEFSVGVKFAATDPESADGPADAPRSLGGGA